MCVGVCSGCDIYTQPASHKDKYQTVESQPTTQKHNKHMPYSSNHIRLYSFPQDYMMAIEWVYLRKCLLISKHLPHLLVCQFIMYIYTVDVFQMEGSCFVRQHFNGKGASGSLMFAFRISYPVSRASIGTFVSVLPFANLPQVQAQTSSLCFPND